MSERDATAADLPAIDRVFRQSFCDTFAHLYRPEDLAAFLAQFTPQAWGEEFADPAYRFRVAEADGAVVGYVKLGPSALPIDTASGAIELRQLYVLKEHHGSGIARRLTDWAIEQARFSDREAACYLCPRARHCAWVYRVNVEAEMEGQGAIFGGLAPRNAIPELLSLYQEGQLKLDELVTTKYSLEEVNQGYQDMRDGKNIRGMIIYTDADRR